MTRTRTKLRPGELDGTADAPPADEPAAREGRRRFGAQPPAPVRDDLEDLWTNVPL